MSPEISVSLHAWRGIGPEFQLSLFYVGFRLGFLTVSFSRDWVLQHYRITREAMEKRAAWDRAQEPEQPRNAHGFPSVSAQRG